MGLGNMGDPTIKLHTKNPMTDVRHQQSTAASEVNFAARPQQTKLTNNGKSNSAGKQREKTAKKKGQRWRKCRAIENLTELHDNILCTGTVG